MHTQLFNNLDRIVLWAYGLVLGKFSGVLGFYPLVPLSGAARKNIASALMVISPNFSNSDPESMASLLITVVM